MKKLILLVNILCFTTALSYAQMSLQLTPSNYNGYNVSCFGGNNGSINLTVTGGTSPYTYSWSNTATTEDISGLRATYYHVLVTDASLATAEAIITLTEPLQFSVSLNPSVYTLNGRAYNISCAICYDGSITSSLTNGIAPVTYLWEDNSTTQNRSGLYEGTYSLRVTDNNLCIAMRETYLDAPERTDWQMTGNTGSNPPTQFIGTTDNKDLVFKTNNAEILTLKSNGELKANSLSGTGNSLLMTDANGVVTRSLSPNVVPWYTRGNDNINSTYDFIGTINNAPMIFRTNNAESFRITESGDIRIKEYENTSAGLFYNDNGFIEKIDFTSPNDVLLGNGTFGALPGGAGYWALTVDNDLYNTNSTGNIYIRGEDRGLIVDDQSHQRIGFMKYTSKEAGIWRVPGQGFEIGRLTTGTLQNPGGFTTDLYIDGNGKVGIGTTPPASGNYFLFVTGGIATRDVKVQATGWPDYIFDTSYQPIGIYELEQFIKYNKHLPGIPSAKEVVENDGYELGYMVQKLLEKTEEQSLYIIEQQKQIDELKVQVKNLGRRK